MQVQVGWEADWGNVNKRKNIKWIFSGKTPHCAAVGLVLKTASQWKISARKVQIMETAPQLAQSGRLRRSLTVLTDQSFAEQVVGSFFDYGNIPGYQHYPPYPPPQWLRAGWRCWMPSVSWSWWLVLLVWTFYYFSFSFHFILVGIHPTGWWNICSLYLVVFLFLLLNCENSRLIWC